MAILILGIVIAVGMFALTAVLVPFNVRGVRAARRAEELPEEIRRQVLESIDLAGKDDGTLALLLRKIEGLAATRTLESAALPSCRLEWCGHHRTARPEVCFWRR